MRNQADWRRFNYAMHLVACADTVTLLTCEEVDAIPQGIALMR
jgi:hypothetical protein